MNKLKLSLLVLSMMSTSALAATMTVNKSPNCGCCKAWVDIVKKAGYEVQVNNVQDLTPFKQKHGVPSDLMSCHTAVVDGYVIEGHVPVVDIQRLLKEKPAIAGLSVPGMPASSPGMDVPGRNDPYKVVSFTKTGKKAIYNSYND